jgi:hypothetical protein
MACIQQGAHAPAPGTAYFTLSPALQTFYAARGMWINGQPQGALASMLGPMAWLGTAWASGQRPISFWASDEQLAALADDLRSVGPRGLNGAQLAQTLRRLREAAVRSGSTLATVPSVRPRETAGETAPATPFEPLRCPPAGKAKQCFEEHVMRMIRDFVDFTQSSAYTGADHA